MKTMTWREFRNSKPRRGDFPVFIRGIGTLAVMQDNVHNLDKGGDVHNLEAKRAVEKDVHNFSDKLSRGKQLGSPEWDDIL
jgi:hypothetical protein